MDYVGLDGSGVAAPPHQIKTRRASCRAPNNIARNERAMQTQTAHESATFKIALQPDGRAFMTRDMELIRRILVEIQSRKNLDQKAVKIDGVDNIILGRHVEMLFEAGMIDGIAVGTGYHGYREILVSDLKWEGHDFIAILQNTEVWNKIKQSFSAAELAGMPLSVVKDIGIGLFKDWAKKKAGLIIGTDG
jgi:hypothetical protein